MICSPLTFGLFCATFALRAFQLGGASVLGSFLFGDVVAAPAFEEVDVEAAGLAAAAALPPALDVVVVAPLAVAWLAFLSSSGVGAILTVFWGLKRWCLRKFSISPVLIVAFGLAAESRNAVATNGF